MNNQPAAGVQEVVLYPPTPHRAEDSQEELKEARSSPAAEVSCSQLPPAPASPATVTLPTASFSKTIPSLVYLERRVNVGTRTYSKLAAYSELPEQYRPDTCNPHGFQLPLYVVPRKMIQRTLANPDPVLLEMFMEKVDREVLFAVHPVVHELEGLDMPDKAQRMPPWLHLVQEPCRDREIGSLTVLPTASSRSVVVIGFGQEGEWNGRTLPPFGLKLHCPVQISRYVRNLGPRTIRHSVMVSRDLELLRIPILPETIGFSLPPTDDKFGWGFIVRELTVRPSLSPERRTCLIPCFSLFARDSEHMDADPLLVKLIREQTERSPARYILDFVMLPIIRDFCIAFSEVGILLEAHAQNSLLEVDAETHVPIRIVHRDLDDTVDARVRSALGLPIKGFSDYQLILEPTQAEPEGSVHSLIFDSSIGHHHFDYLAALAKQFFDVPETLLQEECCAEFARMMPASSMKLFPNEIYYYLDRPLEQNVFPLGATGRKPVWRPVPK